LKITFAAVQESGCDAWTAVSTTIVLSISGEALNVAVPLTLQVAADEVIE
jgi:hypothetical protein